MLFVTTPTTNDKNGSGKYSTPRRRRVKKAKNPNEFSYLRKNHDLTMQFNTSKDPIYTAFDYIENRSVGQLMGDFVKDSFFEITNFVSKVVR